MYATAFRVDNMTDFAVAADSYRMTEMIWEALTFTMQ
jgi:hypothetical protein